MARWWGRIRRGWDASYWPQLTTQQKVGLTLLVAVIYWRGELGPAVCHLPLSIKATNFDDRTWCFEFWLNRYQTLIGAVTALVAAYTAWMSVQKQIHAQRLGELTVVTNHLRSLSRHIGRARVSVSALRPENLSIAFIDVPRTPREVLFSLKLYRHYSAQFENELDRAAEIASTLNMTIDVFQQYTLCDNAGYEYKVRCETILRTIEELIDVGENAAPGDVMKVIAGSTTANQVAYTSAFKTFDETSIRLMKALSAEVIRHRDERKRMGMKADFF